MLRVIIDKSVLFRKLNLGKERYSAQEIVSANYKALTSAARYSIRETVQSLMTMRLPTIEDCQFGNKAVAMNPVVETLMTQARHSISILQRLQVSVLYQLDFFKVSEAYTFFLSDLSRGEANYCDVAT